MMKASLKNLTYKGVPYQSILLCCPGCHDDAHSGYIMLPVNTDVMTSWKWDGNLETPTLEPSILTWGANDSRCHSYLRNGVWEFLSDCTHSLAGQHVPMMDFPEWTDDGE